VAAESRGFAGDSFARVSGNAAEMLLLAWDSGKKLEVKGAIHVQANPKGRANEEEGEQCST
jgi:hypothetical protein